MPTQAAQALMAYAELRGGPHSRHHSQEKILINGSERGVVTFAGCCQPIPGDEIMGYHTAGKGIVVHRMDCPNLAELRKSPERWVPIGWDTTVSGDYDTSLVVEVENGTGVLAQLAAAIAQSQRAQVVAVHLPMSDVVVFRIVAKDCASKAIDKVEQSVARIPDRAFA